MEQIHTWSMNKGKAFELYFKQDYFHKRDILVSSKELQRFKVVKAPRVGWLKRLLMWLGFKVRISYKVEMI